jgi:hypothetical protein
MEAIGLGAAATMHPGHEMCTWSQAPRAITYKGHKLLVVLTLISLS